MFILKKGHQPGVYVPLRALFLVLLLSVTSVHVTVLSTLLYPRHLCRRVYSFRLSVRPFLCSLVRSFVEFASKFCVKVSQVVYISATSYQKAFIFGP